MMLYLLMKQPPQNGENSTAAEQMAANSASEVTEPQPVTAGPKSWIDQIMNNPVIAGVAGAGLFITTGSVWLDVQTG